MPKRKCELYLLLTMMQTALFELFHLRSTFQSGLLEEYRSHRRCGDRCHRDCHHCHRCRPLFLPDTETGRQGIQTDL